MIALGEGVGLPTIGDRDQIARPAPSDTVVALTHHDFDIAHGYDWPAAFTGRALVNRFTATWHGREDALEREAPAERARYAKAAASGDFDTAVIFSGEGIDMIHSIESAGVIVERLVADAEAALARRFD